MKRKLFIFFMLSILPWMAALRAQDTLTYNDTCYLMYDPFYLDSSIITLHWFGHDNFGLVRPNVYYGYPIDEPTWIYGIAVTSMYRPSYPNLPGYELPENVDSLNLDLYALLIEKEGDGYYRADSVRWSQDNEERWSQHNYWRYFNYHTHAPYDLSKWIDTVVPCHEFYFATPRLVFDSIFIGISSAYDTNYPHLYKTWSIAGISIHYRSITDGVGIPYIQFANGRWYNGTHPIGRLWGGWFPIVLPPDTDAVECAGVRNFRQSGYFEGRPRFDWDRLDGRERYQVAYGRADEDPEDYRTMLLTGPPFILSDNTLDSTALYAVRIRTRCHHTCPVHDTVVWSEWSDTVQFYAREHAVGIARTADGGRAFTLSPNPAKGRVTVTVGEGVALPCVLTLRDEAGRELLRHRMEERVLNLPTRGLMPGLYLATVESPQGSTTQRLVVK